MSPIVALFPLLAPLALFYAAHLSRSDAGRRPAKAMAAARWASLFAFAVAIASAVKVALLGAGTSLVIGPVGLGFSARMDALSAVMMLVISFVGVIVVQYSRAYLDGEARQGAFFGGLCATLAAALLLVMSGNLIQLVGAWIAMSLCLHRLLVFRADRARAVAAAFKKSVFARIGDLALMGAAAAMLAAFGTADIAGIDVAARAIKAEGGEIPTGATIAAVLVVVAALMKSAQFPFQGWLPEVVGTPTPVSALLHAGIVNSGGFLAVRFSDVLVLSPGAMVIMAAVGGFTALLAAMVMLTQSSAKGALAWSTISQMGFMMLQCGLGAFSLAVLHIVTHSLYKAHAFLSAGNAVRDATEAKRIGGARAVDRRTALIGLGAAVSLYLVAGFIFGAARFDGVQTLALGAIVAMGLGHLITQGLAGGEDAARRAGIAAALVAVVYAALQAGMALIMADSVPPKVVPTPLQAVVLMLAVGSFAAAALAQAGLLMSASDPHARMLRVHVSNGLYVDALWSRLFAALRRHG
ncbi:MAG: proton-conducting transporter membrane subunit, partial [Pseudomonadota bacterium]